MKFNVTYERFTTESLAHGDADERGHLAESVSLREALDEINGGEYVEADSSPPIAPRWFTFYDVTNGTREYYETDVRENRSLHLPDDITAASARRIARLVGAYGWGNRG